MDVYHFATEAVIDFQKLNITENAAKYFDLVIIYQQYSFLVMRKITICVLWPILDSALERQQT